ALCRRLNCSQKKYPVACAAVAEGSCESGCVCQYGLLRTANGTCVPESQCYGDLVCSDNEVVNSCPKKCINDFCPKSEGDNGRCCSEDQQESESCGEPVCICGFNYKRSNENGVCIPTRSCPPFKCTGKNEEYNSCPPLCPTDDCSQASPTGRCPQIGRIGIVLECSPACRCITGYWRKNGVCVPYAECREYYKECNINRETAERIVSRGYNSIPPLCATGSCSEAFDQNIWSKSEATPHHRFIGYWKNREPADKRRNTMCCMTGKCPINEKYSSCIQGECRALNCTQKGQPIACPDIAEGSCQKGCVCVEGTLRAANGSCVPEDKCPATCPKHEELSKCVQNLGRAQNCTQRNRPIAYSRVARKSCKKECVCVQGYLRDSSGKCIPENKCPGDLVCKENEVVNNCPNSIIGDYCPKNEKEAKLSPKVLSEPCAKKPKCTCRFNYKRTAFKCHRKNEEYNSCPPLCPTDDCSQATPTGRCPLPGRIGIVQVCRPACRCITGYWRKNGVCGPYAQCPGICSANERYSSCIQAECRALNCTQKGQPIACPRVAEGFCQKGCVCVEGTLRAADGSCVPEDKCPAICPANEEFSNCTQAICRHLNCSQQGQPLVCAAVAEGSCLTTCPANEEFSDCTQAICRHLNCSQQGLPLVCAAVAEGSCLSGCVCQSGYLRTDSGTCVPENQCYPITCPANEQFSNCTQGVCRAQDCAQRGQPVPCPGIAEGYCEQGCVCVEGTLRDPNGNCVPEHQCPAVCRAQNCTQSGQSIACPAVAEGSCESGCICMEGTLRNENGDCVPEKQCKAETCPLNEEYSECTQIVCRAQKCSQKGKPVPCPGIAEGSCKTGCVCKTGTLRDESGCCVPEDECPTTCPANEEFSNCTQAICRHLNCSQQGQPLVCAAVAEGSCLTTCPANEEFSDCTQAICRHLNCSQQGLPLVCAAVAEGSCLSGCVCQSGYLRTDSGTCVPENQCYPITCPANEQFSNCTQGVCRAQDCAQRGQPVPCPGIAEGYCEQGCVCVEGTLRDPNGNCVPEHQCPAVCRAQNCTQSGQSIACPAVAEGSCKSGCICMEGTLRNENGDCVPEKECKAETCPPNEEYSECTQIVCRAQKCSQKGKPVPCPGIAKGSCKTGCVCKTGTLRDESGCCVPEEQCPTIATRLTSREVLEFPNPNLHFFIKTFVNETHTMRRWRQPGSGDNQLGDDSLMKTSRYDQP
ncbi:Serine protease inhibitor 28, partial [Operophtera brumata]